MVSIPVRLFPATQDKDVSFHLLHEPDHSRIKFKRFCAAEDDEVPNEELVKAYEVSKDQYVEITDEDLEQLPLPARHTIELAAFVNAREIDPIYYDKSYYLEPEESGVKPYALLTRVLEEKAVTGVASIAIRNKESLCALRPLDGTLLLETLHYPDEIRERELDMAGVSVNARELAVASSLVDALAEPFKPDKYHDHYREALMELIKSKAEGREVVVPESTGAAPQVTDLMSALRASIEAAKGRKTGGGSAASRPVAAAEHKRASGSGDHAASGSRARSRSTSKSTGKAETSDKSEAEKGSEKKPAASSRSRKRAA
jgi:DNA end-binding protein Ku